MVLRFRYQKKDKIEDRDYDELKKDKVHLAEQNELNSRNGDTQGDKLKTM